MHRTNVLAMYRGFLRSVRTLKTTKQQPVLANELLGQIRNEFRAHQHDDDAFQKQRALVEGKRRQDELRGLTGESAAPNQHQKHIEQEDADSWMSIVDPDDQRGRVGQGWPWQKNV